LATLPINELAPPITKSPRGRKPTCRENNFCYELLHKTTSFKQAIDDYPFIDDIINGVCNLHWGGTRGLNTKKIYTLLSQLKEISTESVQNACNDSTSHSRKIAEALRICATAIENEFKYRNNLLQIKSAE